MIIEIINKILITLYVLASLNVIRHLFLVSQTWINTYNEETNEEIDEIKPTKYKLNQSQLLVFGLSLAYVIGGLFSGITI